MQTQSSNVASFPIACRLDATHLTNLVTRGPRTDATLSHNFFATPSLPSPKSFYSSTRAFKRFCYQITKPGPSSIILSTMDSSSVKQSVMKQVLAEANLANARVLIEVGTTPPSSIRNPAIST